MNNDIGTNINFNVLHVSKKMADKFDGVDYVVSSLIDDTNNDQAHKVSAYYLNGLFSLKRAKSEIDSSDIVIFHRVYCILSALLMLYCCLATKKFVLFPHSGFTKNSQKKSFYKKLLYKTLFLDFILAKASSVHYLNEDEFKASINFKANSHFIVPNGISMPDLQSLYSYKFEGAYLAFVGRYDIHHKGIDILLQGIENNRCLLLDKKISVIMHGYSNNNQELEKILGLVRSHKLEELVHINETIKDLDKYSFLNSSIGYILTSRYEGLPTTVLEALSVNRQCLVTNSTNMADLINKNGWGLSCDTTPEGVTYMINKFISKEMYSININSREILEENYSWQCVSKQLLKIYKGLC